MRLLRTCVLAVGVALAGAPVPARADNPMGYTLLTADQAAALPHGGGSLGLAVQRARQVSDHGMTFDLMQVTHVTPGAPGAQAGIRPGDVLIAVDGQVFPNLATFADYVRSLSAGQQATVDYIPAGGGPAQAQRVGVSIARRPGQAVPPGQGPQQRSGLSTGSKVAIGVGAAAILGCYETGCVSRLRQYRRASSSGPHPQAANGNAQPQQASGR